MYFAWWITLVPYGIEGQGLPTNCCHHFFLSAGRGEHNLNRLGVMEIMETGYRDYIEYMIKMELQGELEISDENEHRNNTSDGRYKNTGHGADTRG